MFKIDIDCLKTCHQKMYIYILLVDYHDEAGTYLQSIKAESRCNEQKTRRSNAGLSRKEPRKKKMDSSHSLSTHHTSQWIVV